MKTKVKKTLYNLQVILLRITVVALFLGIMVVVIMYARGYRPNFKTKSFTPTGILATSSSPKAASVYLNGALKGVTDLNLTLPPGEYTIEMKKEGYTDWKKTVTLKGEIVMSVDGFLFPRNPSLSPLTSLGVIKAIPVDSTDQLILISDNNNTETDGIYIFDLNKRPLSLLPPIKLILSKKYIPANAQLASVSAHFSSDHQQAILDFPIDQGAPISYLISLGEENLQPFDITNSKEALLTAWSEERNKDISRILETFPTQFAKIATDSFKLVAFSPDETKLLYVAAKSVTIPRIINPPLIGASQAQESRDVEPNKLYVYDWKEDKNFEVTEIKNDAKKTSPAPTKKLAQITPSVTPAPELLMIEDLSSYITWYSDSKHLITKDKREIIAVDYDGGNKRTIYSGPFEESFFSVSSDGKLIVLTNLNPQYNKSPDLYQVGIR